MACEGFVNSLTCAVVAGLAQVSANPQLRCRLWVLARCFHIALSLPFECKLGRGEGRAKSSREKRRTAIPRSRAEGQTLACKRERVVGLLKPALSALACCVFGIKPQVKTLSHDEKVHVAWLGEAAKEHKNLALAPRAFLSVIFDGARCLSLKRGRLAWPLLRVPALALGSPLPSRYHAAQMHCTGRCWLNGLRCMGCFSSPCIEGRCD